MNMKSLVASMLLLSSLVCISPSQAMPGVPYQADSTTDWMQGLSDSTTLNNIMMPGSHDAGMSQTEHCSFGVPSDEAQTQSLSILGQAEAGSRYFDIRVDYDHDQLTTYHRTDGFGCGGEYLVAPENKLSDRNNVMDNAVDFLKDHPDETLILKFSHTRNDGSHHASDIANRVINTLETRYGQYLYRTTDLSPDLAYLQLGQVRGKIIAVFDSEYTQYLDPTNGIFSYRDYGKSGYHLQVYDKYSNTPYYKKMSNDQLAKLKKRGGLGQDYLFLLSWTLTPSPGNIKKYAEQADGHLEQALKDVLSSGDYPKPNIVYLDFMSSELGDAVVQYNQELAK